MFSGTKSNSFVPRGEKVTRNHSQLSFLLLKLCSLLLTWLQVYTIARRLLKLSADLIINVTRGEGKQAIGEIPSLQGAVGCHVISVQCGIAVSVGGGALWRESVSQLDETADVPTVNLRCGTHMEEKCSVTLSFSSSLALVLEGRAI